MPIEGKHIERLPIESLDPLQMELADSAFLDPERPGVEDIIDQIVAGLRSACTYAGASSIEEFHDRAVVGVQSAAGYDEGRPLGRVAVDNQVARTLLERTVRVRLDGFLDGGLERRLDVVRQALGGVDAAPATEDHVFADGLFDSLDVFRVGVTLVVHDGEDAHGLALRERLAEAGHRGDRLAGLDLQPCDGGVDRRTDLIGSTVQMCRPVAVSDRRRPRSLVTARNRR